MRRWMSASRRLWISCENAPVSERLALRAAARCWRRSGRQSPRPGPGRSCRSGNPSVNSPGWNAAHGAGGWPAVGSVRRPPQAARQQQLQHHGAAVGLQLQQYPRRCSCGAGKYSASPGRWAGPGHPLNGRWYVVRGLEGVAAQPLHQRRQPLPDTRTRCRRPAPGAVAMATMGSVAGSMANFHDINRWRKPDSRA